MARWRALFWRRVMSRAPRAATSAAWSASVLCIDPRGTQSAVASPKPHSPARHALPRDLAGGRARHGMSGAMRRVPGRYQSVVVATDPTTHSSTLSSLQGTQWVGVSPRELRAQSGHHREISQALFLPDLVSQIARAIAVKVSSMPAPRLLRSTGLTPQLPRVRRSTGALLRVVGTTTIVLLRCLAGTLCRRSHPRIPARPYTLPLAEPSFAGGARLGESSSL